MTYIDVTEAAKRLHCEPETVRRLIRDGTLPAARLGGRHGHLRIAESDLHLALRPVRDHESDRRGQR